MAQQRRVTARRNGWMIAALWFSGIALFVMELNAGLDYVQARVSEQMQNSLGVFPALGLAAWKVVAATFWHYGQLEAGFRILPLVTLPFLLLGLALLMKRSNAWHSEESTEK